MFLESKTDNKITLTDEEVFIGSLKNPELFSVIFDRYQEMFLRKARSILQNEQDAYDAVQEVFVRMYSSARHYRKLEGVEFKSWAYKILMNQCFTLYQKRKKTLAFSPDLDDEILASIPDTREMNTYNQKLTKDHVMSLLSRLPRLLSRVMHLYFIEDLSQKEIASMEGISNEVVRARIHRAKQELRKIENNLSI